jgi:FMN phosphatase YigB (HAD superfamily)
LTLSGRRLDAVTFDYWNTLVREAGGSRDGRVDAWLGLLEGEGVALERERLGAAFDSTWQLYVEHWQANRLFGANDAVDAVLAALDEDPGPAVRRALVEVITDPPPERTPSLTDHIAGCLDRLRSAGLRIGIICDVGLTPSVTLRRWLVHHGLLDRFDHWSFSDEVGVFKPDPAIFAHALEGLGVEEPGRAAHVGDLRRTDVAGSRAAGMVSVRYTGVFDDPGPEHGEVAEAELVVADHADLPRALNLDN